MTMRSTQSTNERVRRMKRGLHPLHLCLLLLLSLVPADLYAQDPRLRFSHLSLDDGLSQGDVGILLQDSLGFMWMGTEDGLNRYDGYELRVFKPVPFDSTSLRDTWIRGLVPAAGLEPARPCGLGILSPVCLPIPSSGLPASFLPHRRPAGNPAAICLLPTFPEAAWMQHLAAEMSLSETAFLLAHDDGYDLRWFTPVAEVDLCGHATLASAHVLWEDGLLPSNQVARFHTRSGLLTARRSDGWIEMDFPARPARPCEASENLVEALGIVPQWVGSSDTDLLVLLETEKQVRSLMPDIGLLRRIDVRGVIVTAEAVSEGSDFVSRFFAPRVGVDEDPVTGSAHCTLAPFWQERLGRSELSGYQVSSRGGKVRTRVDGERVKLAGQAVTVLRAELM